MIKYSRKANVKDIVNSEREILNNINSEQLEMKKKLESYIKNFNNLSFSDQSFKTILLNDLNNSIWQIDNNLQDIQSLNDILDILETQSK